MFNLDKVFNRELVLLSLMATAQATMDEGEHGDLSSNALSWVTFVTAVLTLLVVWLITKMATSGAGDRRGEDDRGGGGDPGGEDRGDGLHHGEGHRPGQELQDPPVEDDFDEAELLPEPQEGPRWDDEHRRRRSEGQGHGQETRG